MKKKFVWVIGALVVVLLTVGVYGISTVYADNNNPPLPSGQLGLDGPGGPHGGRGLSDAELAAVANVLNMSADDLSAALQNGQTQQELADTSGVDMQQVRDALSMVRETEMRNRITQAVSDGTITQEHADWLLEGLDKDFLDGPGFGFGFGGHFEKGLPLTSPTSTQ